MCPGSAGSEGDFEALVPLWESPNFWMSPGGQSAGKAAGDRGRLPLEVQLWTGRDNVSLEGLGNVLGGSSTLQSSTAFSLFLFIFGFRGVCATNPARV